MKDVVQVTLVAVVSLFFLVFASSAFAEQPGDVITVVSLGSNSIKPASVISF